MSMLYTPLPHEAHLGNNKPSLIVVILASLVILSGCVSPTDGPAVETLQIFVAPNDECSDDGDGSRDRPICNIGQADKLAESAYANGEARGDIEIRFLSGSNPKTGLPRVHYIDDEWDIRDRVFGFSPLSGSMVRFIPDWYTTEEEASDVPRDQYPQLSIRRGENFELRDENLLAMEIVPRERRGGSYEIAYLNFSDLYSGFRIDGGLLWHDEKEKPRTQAPKGIVRGSAAPVDQPVIRNNIFRNIGTSSSDSIADSNQGPFSVLLFRNVTNPVIYDNTFSQISDGAYVIYAIGTSGGLFENNRLDEIERRIIHTRMSGDWSIRRNIITNMDPELSVAGNWFHSEKYEDDPDYAECRYDPPKFEGNIVRTPDGSVHPDLYQDVDYKEQSGCTAEDRVFPPAYLRGFQVDETNYKIEWGKSDTSSGALDGYKITIGNEDVGEPVSVSVGPETRSFTITSEFLRDFNLEAYEENFLYVQGIHSSGKTSPRTSNKIHFQIMETFSLRQRSDPILVFSFDHKLGSGSEVDPPSPTDRAAVYN